MPHQEALSAGLPSGLGVVLKIGGAIASGLINRGSRRKLRRARSLQRLDTQLANAQAKRAFIVQAKLARANVLSGATSEGALDSSRTQGQLANWAYCLLYHLLSLIVLTLTRRSSGSARLL